MKYPCIKNYDFSYDKKIPQYHVHLQQNIFFNGGKKHVLFGERDYFIN
jgi:hypothetical protein